jgi:hypothetical protein
MKRHKKEVHGVGEDNSSHNQNGISYNSEATTEDESEEAIKKYTCRKSLNFGESVVKVEGSAEDTQLFIQSVLSSEECNEAIDEQGI